MSHSQPPFNRYEFAVAVLLVGALAAVVGPALIPAPQRSKTPDATRLKRLVETYLSGQAQARAKRTPTSVGHRFWIALCIGDGPGAGYLEVDGPDDLDSYMDPETAAYLLTNTEDDRGAFTRDEVQELLQLAMASGRGLAALTPEEADQMCSYAGPMEPRKNMRDKKGLIVACNTDRNGQSASAFDDGFNAVTASAQARYYNYRDMVDEFGWPEGVQTPQFGQDPLSAVVR